MNRFEKLNWTGPFLRGANPTNLVAFWRALNEFGQLDIPDEGDGSGFGHYDRGYLPKTVLTYASRVVRVKGWVSKTAAMEYGKVPTSTGVNFAMGLPPKDREDREEWKKLQPQEEDEARALEVMEWIERQDSESEYIYKLQLILKEGMVSESRVSLLASAFAGYLRDLGETRSKAARADKTNEWFGTVGERIVLELQIIRMRVVESFYGTTTIIALEDVDGRAFTWFASGDKPDLEEGMFVTGKATIKGHDTYKETKQTKLTRASFEEFDPTAPKPVKKTRGRKATN